MGNTLDFMLSAKRDGKAAERFFRKVLRARHIQSPRVITVDKNAAYPKAIETLKADETLSETTELRQKIVALYGFQGSRVSVAVRRV